MNVSFRFDGRNLEVRHLEHAEHKVRVGQWRVQKPRGRVVILPGRGDFLEKYTPLARHLNGAGYSVASLDWLGQGASGRLGRHPQAGHIASYNDYVATLRGCLDAFDLTAQPMMWLAYSMGAPVALQALLKYSYDVSKLVLLSPMFGFAELPEPLIRTLSSAANTLGFGRRFAWGERPTDPTRWTFESSQVSSDPAAFAAFREVLIARPHLLLGGSTWGWVGASLKAFRNLRRADLGALELPTLLLGAQDERTVSVEAQKEIARRLPNAEFVALPGKHDLLLSEQEVTEDLFKRIETFLAQNSDSGRSK